MIMDNGVSKGRLYRPHAGALKGTGLPEGRNKNHKAGSSAQINFDRALVHGYHLVNLNFTAPTKNRASKRVKTALPSSSRSLHPINYFDGIVETALNLLYCRCIPPFLI